MDKHYILGPNKVRYGQIRVDKIKLEQIIT